MPTTIYNEPIPNGRLADFHTILSACGGYYLHNPVESPDEWGRWRVSYAYDEAAKLNEHQRRWYRLVDTKVVETRRDQPWRRALRRWKMNVKALFGLVQD